MKKRKYKKIKKTIAEKLYTIAVVIIILLFITMLVMFYKNITLKTKRNELNKYLEGIRVAKSAFIMAAMYYIAIPFVSTIFADKIREYKEQKSKVFLNNQA